MTRAVLLLPLLALLGLATAGYYDPYQGGFAACGAPVCVSQYLRYGSCSGPCAPCTAYVRIYVIRLCRSPTCLGGIGYGPCALCGRILSRLNAVPYSAIGYAVLPGVHAKLASSDLSGLHGKVNRYLGGPNPWVHYGGLRRFSLYNARRLYPLRPRVRYGIVPYGLYPRKAAFKGFRVCGSPYCIYQFLSVGSCQGLCRPCVGVVVRYVFSICSSSACGGGYGSGLGICSRCGTLFPWLGGLGGHLGAGHVVKHAAVHAGAAHLHGHHAAHAAEHHAVHATEHASAHAAAVHGGKHPALHHAVHPLAHAAHAAVKHVVHPGAHPGAHPVAHGAVHKVEHHGVHPAPHADVHHAVTHAGGPAVVHGPAHLAHILGPAAGLKIKFIHKICSTDECCHQYQETGHCNGACSKCAPAYAHVCQTQVCKSQYETQSVFSGNCAFCDGYYTNAVVGGHVSARAGSGSSYAQAHAGPGYAHAQTGSYGSDKDGGDASSSSGDGSSYSKLEKKVDPDLYKIHLKKIQAYLKDNKAKMTHDVNKKKKK